VNSLSEGHVVGPTAGASQALRVCEISFAPSQCVLGSFSARYVRDGPDDLQTFRFVASDDACDDPNVLYRSIVRNDPMLNVEVPLVG